MIGSVQHHRSTMKYMCRIPWQLSLTAIKRMRRVDNIQVSPKRSRIHCGNKVPVQGSSVKGLYSWCPTSVNDLVHQQSFEQRKAAALIFRITRVVSLLRPNQPLQPTGTSKALTFTHKLHTSSIRSRNTENAVAQEFPEGAPRCRWINLSLRSAYSHSGVVCVRIPTVAARKEISKVLCRLPVRV